MAATVACFTCFATVATTFVYSPAACEAEVRAAREGILSSVPFVDFFRFQSQLQLRAEVHNTGLKKDLWLHPVLQGKKRTTTKKREVTVGQ